MLRFPVWPSSNIQVNDSLLMTPCSSTRVGVPGRVYDAVGAAGVLPGVRAGAMWYREGESSHPFPLTCMFRSNLFFLTYLGEERLAQMWLNSAEAQSGRCSLRKGWKEARWTALKELAKS